MIRKPAEMAVEQRQSMRGGPGTVTIRHFYKSEEIKAKCRLCAVLTVPPGAGIGVHKHETEDELYLITKGSGLLDDGNTRTRVGVGDAVLTGNGESHAIMNDGATDLEIVAVIMCY